MNVLKTIDRATRKVIAIGAAAAALGACGDDAGTPAQTADTSVAMDTTGSEDVSTNTDATITADTTLEDVAVGVDTTPDTTEPMDVTPDSTEPLDTAADTTEPLDTAKPADTTADTTTPPENCDPDATPFGGTVVIQGLTLNTLCSATHFNNIRTAPAAKFVQVADVDLGELGNWVPISEFQGAIYSGDGLVISNLTLDGTTTPNTAFIRMLSNGGILSGLTFENATFKGKSGAIIAAIVRGRYEQSLGGPTVPAAGVDGLVVRGTVTVTGATVGGLFRVLDAGAIINRASFEGSFVVPPAEEPDVMRSGDMYVGGISWRALDGAELTRVAFRGDMTFGDTQHKIGGIVAEMSGDASIDGCVVDAEIQGGSNLGGVAAGTGADTSIRNCRVVGQIRSEGPGSGGLSAGTLGATNAAFSYVAASFISNNGSSIAPLTPAGNDGSVFDQVYYLAGVSISGAFGTAASEAKLKDPTDAIWDNFFSWTAAIPESVGWVFSAGAFPTLKFEEWLESQGQ